MTVASEVYDIEYAGDGVTLAFAIPYNFLSNSDIEVSRRDSTGDSTVLSTGFTVTGAGTGSGTCTCTTTPASGYTIRIERKPQILQPMDLVSNDAFPAETVEAAHDRLAYIAQYLRALLERCIQVPAGDGSIGTGMVLDSASARASKFLAFDTAGNLELASSIGSTALTSSAIATTLNSLKRTAGEISAAVTPTDYAYLPDVDRGDIRRYGVTTASSAAAVATAVQAALSSHGYAFIPAGDWNWNPVLFTGTRQRIFGDGLRTQLIYTGNGIAIDFDGYAGCEVSDLVIVATNASAVGVDIGPNGGATRFAHWWRLRRVMVIGNTPNWATTSLASSRSGLADGIRVQKAFYGHAEHCEVSYAVGNGFRMFEQANGNTFTGCHSRDNAVGVKIEGTGTGNSNGNVWQGGNIEASIASSIGIDLGEADRNRFSGRMEVSATSGIHVRVNPPTGTLAQENVFDLECTGTSTGYQLGDASGSSQVKGTIIRGGKVGSAITINNDCVQTRIEVSPSGFAGVTLTDNGYGTILHADLGGGHWYERPSNQNTSAYNHDLTVGTGSSDESLGDNSKTISFTSMSGAFTFEKVNAGGTNLSVLRFGAYRFWVSPTDGKAYIKGSAPTTHSDGTVVGTQT